MLDYPDTKNILVGNGHGVAPDGVLHLLQGSELRVGPMVSSMRRLCPVDRPVELDQCHAVDARDAAESEGNCSQA
jgi:hypothetical protein